MSPHLPRRTSLSVALAGLLTVTGAAWAAPVNAAEVSTPYTCESPALNGNKLNITFKVTTSPAKIYVGKATTPKLIVKAIIPGNIVGLAAFFGVKSASATGNFSIKANGATESRPFVFPRTDIPQTAKDFPVTINVGLAPIRPTAVGTLTYKPGPIAITLTGYNKTKADAAAGDDVGSIDASCTAKTPNQALGQITYVKSPTAIGTPVTFAKGTKKATASVNVVASSGVTPYGKITSTLFRGATKLKTIKSTLVAGKATVVFGPILKKGTYKIVTTYSGSGAHNGSTKTKTFSIS